MEKSADTHPTSCNFLDFNKMSKVKKLLDDAKEQNNPEIDLVDKGITSFEEMPGLCKCLSRAFVFIEILLPNLEVLFKNLFARARCGVHIQSHMFVLDTH